jgi:putative hydrolase of the HAD superfamily
VNPLSRPRQVSAVLFDIGSTLWSSPPEAPEALAACYGRGRALLRAYLPDVPPIEALIEAVEGAFAEHEELWRLHPDRIHQPPTTEYVAIALQTIGLAPDADALADFTEALLDTSVFTARYEAPEPEMRAALDALRERGLRLGCVSNAFMPGAVLERILVERGLGGFEVVVSSCETGVRKPHPAIYEAALSAMEIAAAETVFVGDRLVADVEAPAALGMASVLTQQYRREEPSDARTAPDFVIQHLRELAAYIDRLRDGE